ncbi:hypothetical protein V8C42DRAFT_313049 [Trichoderma barbatum]
MPNERHARQRLGKHRLMMASAGLVSLSSSDRPGSGVHVRVLAGSRLGHAWVTPSIPETRYKEALQVGKDGTQKGAAVVVFRRPLLRFAAACVCMLTCSSRGGDEENGRKRMLREEDGWIPCGSSADWPALG